VRLRVLLPERVIVDRQVTKVMGEGTDGGFCLLPRHVDVVVGLVAGLLAFVTDEEGESFMAIDGGTLVKVGDNVTVSTPQAIGGRPLGQLRRAVADEMESRDERERRAQAALSKIEADMVRRLVELSGAEK